MSELYKSPEGEANKASESPQEYEQHDREATSTIRNLGQLALSADTVLREHQQEAFEDIVDFYARGGRECYVKLPTGTGKTVLFVELCKELKANHDEEEGLPPRVIVLAPTKDLVDQTVGSVDKETGKRRGFKGFAPEIDARAIHGDIGKKKKRANITEAEVLVTTYNTFRNLIGTFVDSEKKTTEEWSAEKSKLHKELISTHREVEELTLDRSQYLTEAYYRQEVRRMRNAVDEYLEQHEIEKHLPEDEITQNLPTTELKWLTDMQSFLGTLPEQPRAHDIKMMRTFVTRNIMTDRMKGGIAAIRKSLERAKQTQADKQQAESKEQRRQLRYMRLDERQQEDAVSDGLKMVDLSPVEQMFTYYLWRHRHEAKITVTNLLDYHDRQTYHRHSEELSDKKQKAKALGNFIDRIDWLMHVKESIGRFELVICDEAHRVIGKETWDAVREFAARKDIALAGFTATDELTDRTLQDYFEEKAHDLSKQEAIKREIVNPVSLFVYNTGLRFGGVELDASGDYDGASISAMRHSPERNAKGVELISLLSEQGYRGIVPCIPGEEAEHAKVMAQLINNQTIIDPVSGKERPLKAFAFTGNTPKDVRQSINKAFEKGELDWLTFIDVLGEGWDSDTAKAMVSMRPTRSPLVATQRLGRIGRTHEGAPISIAVDLFDGIAGEGTTEIPPVLATDVFELDNIEQGTVVGSDTTQSNQAIERLQKVMQQKIIAHNTRYAETVSKAIPVNMNGAAIRKFYEGDTNVEWKTISAAIDSFDGFLPQGIEEDWIDNDKIKTTTGRKGHFLVQLIDVNDIRNLYNTAPLVDPWKLFVDESNTKWISPEGCIKLLSRKFPHLSKEQVESYISEYQELAEEKIPRQVARVQLGFNNVKAKQFGLTSLYPLSKIVDELVPFILEKKSAK